MCPAADYAPGTTLFRQGEPVRTLHLIEDGFVKLTRAEASGHDVLIGLRAPGWLLGAAAALLDLPHPITAETVSPCTLRRLSTPDYLRLLRTDLQVAHWVQRMQARQTYEQVVLLGAFGALGARQRLERFLVRQLARDAVTLDDGRVQLVFKLKDYELAQAIGVSAEHLSRLFARLEADGLIARKKGRLLIPKTSRLLRLTDELSSLDG
jgi:CRP-like cAMP-binding protein